MTDRAGQAIKAILDRIEHSQGEALRLVAGPDGQLALMLDDVKQDDAIVIEDGHRVPCDPNPAARWL